MLKWRVNQKNVTIVYSHSPSRTEYKEREKRDIINDKENHLNLYFFRGITHNIRL